MSDERNEPAPVEQEKYEILNKETGELVPVEIRKGYPLPNPNTALTIETYNVPQFCNSCYLKERCPRYRPDATCYYRIQAKIDGPADIITILKKMMEIQTQRVFFGYFIEKMEGGYPDRTLSDEIERLMRVIKDFRDIVENRDELEVKIKAKGGQSGGILSKLFGLNNQAKTVDAEYRVEEGEVHGEAEEEKAEG